MKTNIFHSPPTLENEKIKLIPLEVHHSAALLEANDPRYGVLCLTKSLPSSKWTNG